MNWLSTMNRLRTNRDFILCNRLFRWARPYWSHLGVLFALSLLASPLALLVPLPLKIAVDSGLASKPLPHIIRPFVPASFKLSPSSALLLAVALLVLVTVFTQIQALAVSLLRTYTAEKLLLDFRSELFRQMQKLSLGYHEVKGTAESLYNLQYDAASVQTLVVDHLIPFFNSAFTLLGMLYVTARIDWRLALIALVISPILYATSKYYRRGLRRGSREVKKLEKSAMGIVQEVLGALRVVKAFGREEDERHRFVRKSAEGMRARLRLALAEGKFNSIVGFTMAAGTATVLFVGIRQVQTGVITLGELLLMMGYVAQLYEPLKTMGRKSAALQSQLSTVERSFATGKVASLSRCLTGTRSFDRLVNDLAGDGWILLEKGAQPLIDKRLNRAGDVGVELAFGLSFELWLRKLYAYYCDQTFTDIVSREVLFEVFEQAHLLAGVVDGARERSAEAGKMRPAIHGIDIVRKTEDRFGVAVVVLQANLHGHAIAFGLHVNRTVVQHCLAAIQVLNELSDAAVVFEFGDLGSARLRISGALIGKRDQESLVEERELAQTLRQRVIVVLDGGEDVLVRKKMHFGAALLCSSGLLQLVLRLTL